MGNNEIKEFAKKIRRVVLFILAIIAILFIMAIVMLIAITITHNRLIAPPKNEFARKIEWEYFWEKDKNGECVIDLAEIMDFEWDSMKYYSFVYELEYIRKDIGWQLEENTEFHNRVVFMHNNEIVYHKAWHYYPRDIDPGGVSFDPNGMDITVYPHDAKFKAFKIDSEGRDGKYIFLEKIE